MTDPILEVRDLAVHYVERGRRIKAVDGVSLALGRGRILALVGESGCGKTTAALAMLGLLPDEGEVVGGEVRFEGRDLLTLNGNEQRRMRGREISMIFQDPVSGLNPVLPIGKQVEEIVAAHGVGGRDEARRLANDALGRVGLAQPNELARRHPFELSGGMAQRVMIAIATVLNPKVVIADEPTSALDVTVQAGILDELERLRSERGVSILLITHDLGVVAHLADEVVVMYAGRVAEHGSTADVLRRPRHPYTWSLLGTLPRIDGERRALHAIEGALPDPAELPDECAFLPRCRKAIMTCRTEPSPPLKKVAAGHRAACYNPVFHLDG